MTLRYLSLFSGIEACTVAWHPLGWEPVAFAQFDPEHDYSRGPDFASAVLAHHYPTVPNLGDVTRIDEADVAMLGPIDLVVGGSPCQDLSVAGNRAGLAGARSGLFHEQVRIFHAARKHCGARFLLWENVPGAFSSSKGRDFAVVVERMAGLADGSLDVPPKGWGLEGAAVGEQGLVEWAVLDAQFFGVAQRRRRVFALLDTGDWAGRPPVLLEPARLRGDPPSRRAPGQDAAAGARAGAATGVDSTSDGGGDGRRSGVIDCSPEGISGTVSSKWVKGTGGPAGDEHYNLVVPPSFDWPQEIADPVVVGENKTWTHEGTTFRTRNLVPAPIAFDTTQITHPENRTRAVPDGPTGALAVQQQPPAIATPMAVRRLTPLECERLQGFPDGYTLIPYRGKPAADGNRYKALGNSMAVPVMRWIGERLDVALLIEGGGPPSAPTDGSTTDA